MSTIINVLSVDWPAGVPIAAGRIISGSPLSSTLVLHRSETTEMGLWRVTPGEFTTVHDGYVEFINIVEGDADLVHDDGTVISLQPGSVVLLESGWRGRWVVREALVKSYSTETSK